MNKTEQKKGSKTNKSIVVLSAIIIVTVFVSIVFIYLPYINKNKDLRTRILQERDRNVLIGKIRALSKHLKVYNKRIPESRGVSWLLSEVTDKASKEQIEVSSIKPGTPEDRGRFTKLYVTMDTLSTYHQLGKFISRIESSEKFLKIESIGIKRLDMDENFKPETARFKAFDVKGHIVISTVVLKE